MDIISIKCYNYISWNFYKFQFFTSSPLPLWNNCHRYNIIEMLNTRKNNIWNWAIFDNSRPLPQWLFSFFLENDEYPSIILMVDSYILFTGYTVVHNCLPEAVREPNSLSTMIMIILPTCPNYLLFFPFFFSNPSTFMNNEYLCTT